MSELILVAPIRARTCLADVQFSKKPLNSAHLVTTLAELFRSREVAVPINLKLSLSPPEREREREERDPLLENRKAGWLRRALLSFGSP